MNVIWKSAAAGVGLWLLSLISLWAQENEEYAKFSEPRFHLPLFKTEDLNLSDSDKEQLIQTLLATAQLKRGESGVSTLAMVYAAALAPDRREVIQTSFYFRNGLEIPLELQSGGNPSLLDEFLADVKAVDNTEDSKATACLEDLVMLVEKKGNLPIERLNAWLAHMIGPGDPYETPAPESPKIKQAKVVVDNKELVQPLKKSKAMMAGLFYANVELRIPDDASVIEARWLIQKAMRSMALEASAVPVGGGPSSIELINDQMPPELSSAMHEMVKMFSLRNLKIPTGNKIQVSFEEGYSGADGPTAVLACAIMVDALVNGTKLDRTFAAVGDLNADGSIQPVYGLDVRLRTAKEGQVEILAVPDVNAKRLGDLVLNGEGDLLLKTQVFTVKDFDEARAVAAAPDVRDQQLQEAITTFAEVQKALNRPNPMSYLRNPQVRERLQKTVQLAPNHASAKLLLLKGANRNPQKLTLVGSINEIQHAAVFLQDGRSPRYDNFRAAINAIGRKRDALDPRCLEWFSAMSNFNTLSNQGGSSLSTAQRREQKQRIDQAEKRIDLEYQKLMSNPEVREALMAK